MKKVKTVKWNGHTFDVMRAEYQVDDSLYLGLYENGEWYCDITVHLDFLVGDYAFVDTNNFPDAEKFLKATGLGEPTGRTRQSGFCAYPLYAFNL